MSDTSVPDRLKSILTELRKENSDKVALSTQFAREIEKDLGITPVEIVSEEEIYLTYPDKKKEVTLRGRRICGAPTKNRQKRCLAPAGMKTAHNGRGRCCFHDSNQNPITILNGMYMSGFALDLKETLSLYPELIGDDIELNELREEIVIARHILSKHIENGQLSAATELLEVIGKLKEKRSKIETEKLSLDPAALKLFVRSIFQLLYMALPPEYYAKATKALVEGMKIPLNRSLKEIASDSGREIDRIVTDISEERDGKESS